MSSAALDVQTQQQYYTAPGLSQSAMKDLAVSPLRFWYLHVNPNRPVIEPSREMVLGTALHCLVFQPHEFSRRFALDFKPEAHHLVTMEDLRAWLVDRGEKPKGTKKADLVAQVHAIDPQAPVVDVLLSVWAAENEGKSILNADDWERLHGMAAALAEEPKVQELLNAVGGRAEVPMFATDPETGVLLKACMDWVAPTFTADLKTFQQKRAGKTIDETVNDAIWFEKYTRQAYFYSLIRRLNEDGGNEGKSKDFILFFVESEQPHEVRMRVLRPTSHGEVNVYWERERVEVQRLIRLYAAYMDTFGTEKPWRNPQRPDPLMDTDLKALAWV